MSTIYYTLGLPVGWDVEFSQSQISYTPHHAIALSDPHIKLQNEPYDSPASSFLDAKLEEQQYLNQELLRICQQQKQLLGQQGAMIVEMLEMMGKGDEKK